MVSLRVYAELNDFVALDRRRREFDFGSAPSASAKHIVEAIGVPHTEVELLLLNGEPVSFDALPREGDRLAVYPRFASIDAAQFARLASLRGPLAQPPRFVADAQLGALARLLRMAGFDTRYDHRLDDGAIERVAHAEGRAVLTRDRALLMRRDIVHGAYVRALQPRAQLREVFERFDLASTTRPFARCMQCNGVVRPVSKAAVESALPERVRARHERFTRCEQCARVYWQGSHWQRMRAMLDSLGAASQAR